MSNKLQTKTSGAIKEKTQYGLTFGVIATMLFVAGFPMIVIFFFGVFAYFLWKTFSQPAQHGVRQVFEFYYSANEILRDDERRWFGFEVQEVIGRGEKILQVMHGAPPLVYFTLGALYNKVENHEAAVNQLSYIVKDDNADESTYNHPSADLREYVKVLRNIEDEPAKAPKTSAAIRSLERARKNRGKMLLEESRQKLGELKIQIENSDHKTFPLQSKNNRQETNLSENKRTFKSVVDEKPEREKREAVNNTPQNVRRKLTQRKKKNEDAPYGERKPITEVLHDIYDKNVQ